MTKLTATWDISLTTECPTCQHDFDLVEQDEFWLGGFRPIEYGTPATTDYEVECPQCEIPFKVDFEY